MRRSDIKSSLIDCIEALEQVQRYYNLYSKDVDDELSEALSHLNEALHLFGGSK